jgi:uridine phosphorylase
VGSSAGLQTRVKPGDLLISEGSLRNDGTTAAYAHPGYPAVPDLRITVELERHAHLIAAREGNFAVHAGISVSDDAFYAETPAWISQLNSLGILNVEMEASAMYVIARLRGLRAAMICSCSSNLVAGASLYDNVHDALKNGWMRSIEAALETAVSLDL